MSLSIDLHQVRFRDRATRNLAGISRWILTAIPVSIQLFTAIANNRSPGPIRQRSHGPLFDVDGNGSVSALDALLVINDLSRSQSDSAESSAENEERSRTDVNEDGDVTAVDALVIINHLSRQESGLFVAAVDDIFTGSDIDVSWIEGPVVNLF